MKTETAKHLLDARNACQAILSFTDGKTQNAYSLDLLLRSAVERQFEILGEALNRLDRTDPSYRKRLPDIGRIIGMRNRIIHGYDSVDDSLVWDAVEHYVPGMLGWLEARLGSPVP